MAITFAHSLLCDSSKYIYSFAATTLTGLHFATTTLMTTVLRLMGYIQVSHLPMAELLKFVIFANFSIVGMNVSLMWNSVGFYQVYLWVAPIWFKLSIKMECLQVFSM